MEFFGRFYNTNTLIYDTVRDDAKQLVDYSIMYIKDKFNPQEQVFLLRKVYSIGKLMIKERGFNDLFEAILLLLQQTYNFEYTYDVKNLVQISFLNLIQIFNSSVYQIIQAKTNEEQALD